MPFTFAHPAAVLPLRRLRYLQTVPLVIGSMVPDVPYFFPERVGRLFPDTHTLSGSFWVCLPTGMVLLIAILLLRDPLTILLGPRLRYLCLRSIDRYLESPLHWPAAILSVLVGSWTHLAWDSFTHSGGWTTLRVAALTAPVSIFGWQTELNHLLQYVSSAFGLAVLALWLSRMLPRVPPAVVLDPSQPRARWLVLGTILTVAVAFGLWRCVWMYYRSEYYHMGFIFLTRSIGSFAAMYLVTGMLVVLGRRLELEPAG